MRATDRPIGFHSLFREFLQHRLRETAPARARALHQRAAQVFAERAAFDRAIPHYLAAEMFDEAASTLEQIAPVFFRRRTLDTVGRMDRHLASGGVGGSSAFDGHTRYGVRGDRLHCKSGAALHAGDSVV
jgi:hypothetical protein